MVGVSAYSLGRHNKDACVIAGLLAGLDKLGYKLLGYGEHTVLEGSVILDLIDLIVGEVGAAYASLVNDLFYYAVLLDAVCTEISIISDLYVSVNNSLTVVVATDVTVGITNHVKNVAVGKCSGLKAINVNVGANVAGGRLILLNEAVNRSVTVVLVEKEVCSVCNL